MANDLTVLVGKGAGGQENLIHAIQDLGINAESAGKCVWPRDDYVYFKGRYLTSHAGGEYNPWGEGGSFRIGEDFMLVSDYALWLEYPGSIGPRDIWVASIEGFKKNYPQANRFWVAPTRFQNGDSGCEHIDLFLLLCPKAKLLLLDTNYGEAINHPYYEEIAEKEGLRIIKYDGSQDPSMFPLNGSVLPLGDTDTILLDEKSNRLIGMLRDQGVNALGVPIPFYEKTAGKVNCQTNFYFKSEGIGPRKLLRFM
jgi:hypothetical protein